MSGEVWLLGRVVPVGGGGRELEVRGERGGVDVPVPQTPVLRACEEVVGMLSMELHLPNWKERSFHFRLSKLKY